MPCVESLWIAVRHRWAGSGSEVHLPAEFSPGGCKHLNRPGAIDPLPDALARRILRYDSGSYLIVACAQGEPLYFERLPRSLTTPHSKWRQVLPVGPRSIERPIERVS